MPFAACQLPLGAGQRKLGQRDDVQHGRPYGLGPAARQRERGLVHQGCRVTVNDSEVARLVRVARPHRGGGAVPGFQESCRARSHAGAAASAEWPLRFVGSKSEREARGCSWHAVEDHGLASFWHPEQRVATVCTTSTHDWVRSPALSRERENFSILLTNSRKVRRGFLSSGRTERDSNSVIAAATGTCDIRKREYCYEEGSFRGARLGCEISADPLVNAQRRE